MENSQSSDVFSNDDYSHQSHVLMDTSTYESMISNTKLSLSRDLNNEMNKPTFPQYFTLLLGDCDICISQSLDLINNLLSNSDVEITKLIEYMTDAIQILQMMSTFIKTVIESVSMSCGAMKTFPTTTGRIIMIVFAHCKDSEGLYAQNVKHVEKQLKDLFRTCHELQLTYLMVLEKHFIFNSTKDEEIAVLLEALDINLKIGEVVQSLDVKTLAAQWKAYTMICEKHSSFLLDKQVYRNCAKIYCSMIKNNIKIALESNQEEKVTLRSLKVASFNLKILLKICNIFKYSTVKSFNSIIDMLIFINLNSSAYQGTNAKKSEKVTNLITTNVSTPTEVLTRELLLDAEFLNDLAKYEVAEPEKDDKSLGFILLVISLLRATVLLSNLNCKLKKHKMISCVYKILPFGHIWFNMGLKFNMESCQRSLKTVGLYEHLLIHTLAVALTLNSEEITFLEQRMYEAIMATDCTTALFSVNLWVLLSGYSSRQLICSQFFSLCNAYQKLEKKELFSTSPQKVHLSYLIKSIFKAMHTDDKFNVYHQFSNLGENISLWIGTELNHFLESEKFSKQDMIKESLKTECNKLIYKTSDLQNLEYLTKLMDLASRYNFPHDDELEAYVVRAWTKLCPKNNKTIRESYDKKWCLDFVGALGSLTSSMKSIFLSSINLIEILHVVSNVIENANAEMKCLFLTVLCKICMCPVQDENKQTTNEILIKIIKIYFHEPKKTLQMRFLAVLKRYEKDSHLNYLISETNERFIQETWKRAKHGCLKMQSNDLKEQLTSTVAFKYRHKCMLDQHEILLSDSSMSMDKIKSTNLDFADIYTFFDAADSDSEPACKKTKLNTNDVENIVVALETNTNMLCDIKENLLNLYKSRIREVCDKLKNIID